MRGKNLEAAQEEHMGKAAQFAEGLSAWYGSGRLPGNLSPYVQDGLLSMQKRFQRKGVKLHFSIKEKPEVSQDSQTEASGTALAGKGKFLCIREWTIEKNGKEIFEKKEQSFLHLHTGPVTGEDADQIRDYYFEQDNTADNGEILNRIIQWVMLGMIFGLMYVLFFILISNQADRALILTAPAVGGIIGYVVIALRMSGGLIRNAVRTMSSLRQEEETRLQAVMVMENTPVKFSYPEFEHRLLSLVYRVLMEENISRFPDCEQEVVEGCLRDIVDAVWTGTVEYEGFHYEEPHCELKLKVHMIDTYVAGKNVFQRKDIFHVTVYKDVQNEDRDWIIRSIWRDE